MAAQSSSFLYFLRKCSFNVPDGEAPGVLRLSSRYSESEGECDLLLIWLLTWLPIELGVSSAIIRRLFGSVGRSIKLSSKLMEHWLPYFLWSSVDGDLSSFDKCWSRRFSLLGDHVFRLMIKLEKNSSEESEKHKEYGTLFALKNKKNSQIPSSSLSKTWQGARWELFPLDITLTWRLFLHAGTLRRDPFQI